MKSNIVTAAVIAAMVAGGAGFWGGMKYQATKQTTARNNFASQARPGDGQNQGRRFNGTGGRPVVGSILSMDDKSMTVKMADGSSRIVILSDTTKYSKTTDGAKTDLNTGEQVGVFGTDNSDGSITAQTVQLNPQFRGFGSSPTPTP